MEPRAGGDLKNTNEALQRIFEFLFIENSLLTWVHIAIFLVAILLGLWLWYLHVTAEKKGFVALCKIPQTPCSTMSKEWLNGVRQSNTQFASAFGIGAVAFAMGVWFESKGGGGMLVQVATYFPAMILALSQIIGIVQSGVRVKRHLGV